MTSKPTYLAFHHNSDLTTLPTTTISTFPAPSLSEPDASLFKQISPTDHILTTQETIFHPQGGGQPSDTGIIKSTSISNPNNPETIFTVTSVRTSISHPGIVYHLGHFTSGTPFAPNSPVTQEISSSQRLLYSRYHTAGHVLGATVRSLLQHSIPNFDELKASHFPDSASCEFSGLIAGSHKGAIQTLLDENIEKDLAVEIDFWDEDEFIKHNLGRLVPDRKMLMPGETKFRVVKIEGLEVYPCGGTHVRTTRECGKTTVKKISRSKGVSRVSYGVDP